jgi:hypothetical protein
MPNENIEVTPGQLISIIGAKEVDACILRGRIEELTKENVELKERLSRMEKSIPSLKPEE